jgi:hypothetical protein
MAPLFGCQCSSIRRDEAAVVYEALTHYQAVKDALADLLRRLKVKDGLAYEHAQNVLDRTASPMPVKPVPEWVKERNRW